MEETNARSLTVVIPALNEEEAIGDTISRCLQARQQIREEAGLAEMEIIVVSDGSTDRTAEIAQGFSEVRTIVFEQNRGYGAAIKEGFRQGRGDLQAELSLGVDVLGLGADDDHSLGRRAGPGNEKLDFAVLRREGAKMAIPGARENDSRKRSDGGGLCGAWSLGDRPRAPHLALLAALQGVAPGRRGRRSLGCAFRGGPPAFQRGDRARDARRGVSSRVSSTGALALGDRARRDRRAPARPATQTGSEAGSAIKPASPKRRKRSTTGPIWSTPLRTCSRSAS